MHPKVVDSFLQFSSSDDEGSFVFPKLAGKATGGTGGLSWHFTQIMNAAGVVSGDPDTGRIFVLPN